MTKTPAITEAVASKVLDLVDQGLVSGMGVQVPGKMCVEAAVCFALGLPHGDEPPCVGRVVRSFKVRLNDGRWSSNQARARGMRRLAVAQLGSDAIDQHEFARLVVDGAIRRVLPMALRAAAWVNPGHADALVAAADRCAAEGTREAARAARAIARAAYAAADAADADAYANAADAAADAAYAAAAAVADADAYAATYAAADAAAAYAYAYAAAYADAADADAYAYAAAAAAADAADAYAYAYAAAAAARELILTTMAEIGEAALVACGSPGVRFLPLCDATKGA